MIRDDAVSLDPLRSSTIGIIGYGNQGRAQALNARDSGLAVEVGARPGKSRDAAIADGFAPRPPGEIARGADLVMLLAPDEQLGALFRSEIEPSLRTGATIGVAHGGALHFRALETPPSSDVFLVAPAGPGVALREEFLRGAGIPALVAVHHDASGSARDRALAYAKAIGCTRAGVLETTVREEAVIDLFGEQAVLCGGLASLVQAGFRTLVEAGYTPEVAYLECVQQIELTARLVTRFGISGMWRAVSRTAAFGGLERGPAVVGEASRVAMREALRAIESGEFFDRFTQDAGRGGKALEALRRSGADADLERAWERVRALYDAPGK